jgi:hypothetical protein
MGPVLAALVLLGAVGLGLAWFLRANPTTVARRARISLVVLGGLAIGALLVLAVPVLPTLLPELFGLGGVVLTGLIVRALRHGATRGFSTPGSSNQRSEAHTAWLEAWIDHGTGEVGGRVVHGQFAGRLLDGLSAADLLALRAECASDPDSLRVLEAYLDRRLGADWREQASPPPAKPGATMGRAEALAVLGLAEGATAEDIRAAHRRLIQRVHPDVGGSADLAARINRAKDILLAG